MLPSLRNRSTQSTHCRRMVVVVFWGGGQEDDDDACHMNSVNYFLLK